MVWLTIGILTLVFFVLALLAGGSGDEMTPNRRRARERLARGGYPPAGWEV